MTIIDWFDNAMQFANDNFAVYYFTMGFICMFIFNVILELEKRAESTQRNFDDIIFAHVGGSAFVFMLAPIIIPCMIPYMIFRFAVKMTATVASLHIKREGNKE